MKEGWDNPNVFQICSLREIGTERERRQTIGRGLRLCVNQEGLRLRGNDINTLTVVATEGYEEFAENLQKEIEADTGIRFGIVEKHQFAAIQIKDQNGKTQLTRGSIVKILQECRRLQDFARNPQQFIEMATEAINRTKRLALVDGIKYHKIGDQEYYAQELFEQEELKGYLKNTVPASKSVYEHIIYDSSGVEKNFAEDLEANEAVKVYAKLPAWFQVPTPLGSYNPDWAILIEDNGQERLYFVVETKGSNWWDDLRSKEGAKIRCGEKHFEEIATDENPARYIRATSVDDVMGHIK